MTCTVEITLHALSQRSPVESIGKGQKLIEAARPGLRASAPSGRAAYMGSSSFIPFLNHMRKFCYYISIKMELF